MCIISIPSDKELHTLHDLPLLIYVAKRKPIEHAQTVGSKVSEGHYVWLFSEILTNRASAN